VDITLSDGTVIARDAPATPGSLFWTIRQPPARGYTITVHGKEVR
jgi:hypothetical protein